MNNKTWWGEKFLEVLKSFIEEGRLQRGSAYRTPNRLSNYRQEQNSVSATMMGNINPYFGVYKVPYYNSQITFSKLSNAASIISNIESDPLLLAKLVTRELPSTISTILPQNSKEIETSCSCPDWENPCKHIAGLYLKIAEEIDYNPLLLFELRGIERKLLSEKIKKYVSSSSVVNTTLIPTKEIGAIELRNFWGNPHKKIKTSLVVKIPTVLIKKAGINPPFWHKRKSFLDSMHNIYHNIKRSWHKQIKP
ncbi:SWIM zinc finger family protein [Candidatus Tisiphia endosymbiont of Nedyus quadrimaculatus]|uniref:SWIM zinc finger family protein n=1 Tax=Candidatus Tisiphia endosymbiont of Nedyus quadrimaculatus TaxID=3139332 RepID=UPI00345EF291